MRKLRRCLWKILPPFHQDCRDERCTMATSGGRTTGAVMCSQSSASIGKWGLLRKHLVLRPAHGKAVHQEASATLSFSDLKKGGAAKATILEDMVEEEMWKLAGPDTALGLRYSSRRVSTSGCPIRHGQSPHKEKRQLYSFWRRTRRRKSVEKISRRSTLTVEKLQTQMDSLMEAVAAQSAQLLAQRQLELERCQSLGQEMVRSSEQFHKISRTGARRRRCGNGWGLCWRCC